MSVDSVKMVVVDVDGVLTDGRIILDGEGNELKHFHVRDGSGLRYLQRVGIECAIITGRTSAAVARRADELGIVRVYQGAKVKLDAYEDLLGATGLADDEICYIGDDLPDLPIMKRVGFPACPADAVDLVKRVSSYVANLTGGHGAVREIAEHIMRGQGKWDLVLQRYFL